MAQGATEPSSCFSLLPSPSLPPVHAEESLSFIVKVMLSHLSQSLMLSYCCIPTPPPPPLILPACSPSYAADWCMCEYVWNHNLHLYVHNWPNQQMVIALKFKRFICFHIHKKGTPPTPKSILLTFTAAISLDRYNTFNYITLSASILPLAALASLKPRSRAHSSWW